MNSDGVMNVGQECARRRRDVCGALVILMVTLAAFAPAMRAGWNWDDDLMLTNNRNIKSLRGLGHFWFAGEEADYLPVTSTSLWCEWRLWKTDAVGYHVTNILLHAANAVLVWLALRKLKVPGAWLAGLVFAVHPVNVASVAWVSQRKNTLSMLFYLLALISYLRFDEDARRHWYVVSLAMFVLALLSKSSVVMLPFVLLGCVWWLHRKIAGKDALRVAPFFALSLIMGAVTIWFQNHHAIGAEPLLAPSLLSRAAGAGWAVWFYFAKALAPLHVSMIYPRWNIDVSMISFVPDALLVALFALFWRHREGWGRPLLFGLGYSVISLAPALGLFKMYFMRYSFVADHWQYVSIIGVIALFAGLLSHVCSSRNRMVCGAVAATLVGSLCVLTWMECRTYRTGETLWRHTARKNPGAWNAYNCLGLNMSDHGHYALAAGHFARALRIEPNIADIHSNMGNALMGEGDIEEAIGQYREALAINPRSAKALNNWGNALESRGMLEAAIEKYWSALEVDPENAAAHYNVANALSKQGRFADAIAHYEESIRVDPDRAEAWANMGIALSRMGRLDDAIRRYREAIRLKPRLGPPRYNLGMLLRRTGRLGEAARELEQAANLMPDNPDVLNDLAGALDMLGEAQRASVIRERARQLETKAR